MHGPRRSLLSVSSSGMLLSYFMAWGAGAAPRHLPTRLPTSGNLILRELSTCEVTPMASEVVPRSNFLKTSSSSTRSRGAPRSIAGRKASRISRVGVVHPFTVAVRDDEFGVSDRQFLRARRCGRSHERVGKGPRLAKGRSTTSRPCFWRRRQRCSQKRRQAPQSSQPTQPSFKNVVNA